MAQTRSVIPGNVDNVDKAVFAIIGETLREIPPIWRKYFNIESSDRKFERNMSYAMFGAAPQKGEGEDFTTSQIKQAYTKDFTHLEFGLAFEVTQTAQEDDVYSIISQYGTGLARSCRVTEETFAANILANGHTTETSPDGQALFASAHPLIQGGTASNTGALALSWSNLNTAIVALNTDQKSEEGFFTAPVNGLQLVVPPALKMLALRLVGSGQLPQSADNDINPIKSDYNIDVIVNPYLTSTTKWYLLYKGKQHGIMSYTRVPIGMQPPERLPRSGNRFYAVRFRRSWGARQWQGAWGSSGA